MFEILCERPLPVKYRLLYRDITFDGHNYYLTLTGDKKITRMSPDWQIGSVFTTERRYTCFCYDTREECFWAASDNICSVIFKLNRSFQEMGRFSLNPFEGYVTALSYCAGDDTISIAVGSYFLNFNKISKERFRKIRQCRSLIMGIGSICPYSLCCELRNSQQALSVLTQSGSLVKEFMLPPQYVVSSVLIKQEDRNHYYLQLLASKLGDSYILEALLVKDELVSPHCSAAAPAVTPSCDDDRPPDSTCPPPLPNYPYPCPPASAYPPPLPNYPNPCTPQPSYIPHPIYIPFPQQTSCSPYPFPCCPPITPPDSPCTPNVPCCNGIFHSIAHANSLIAKILQAESEKIEQADPDLEQLDQLLALNESTNRIITSVTHLEQTFYALLDITLRGCCTASSKTKQVSINEIESDTPPQ